MAKPTFGWLRLALAIVILAGLGVRLWSAATLPLSFDETWSAHLARLSWAEMHETIWGADNHPPLFYWLLWALSHAFGQSLATLRGLSVLAGGAAIVLAWLLGRQLGGEGVGMGAAALSALSAGHLSIGYQVRNYSLVILLGTVCVLLYVRWWRRPTWAALVWFGGVWLVLCLTSYTAALLLPPLLVHAALTRRPFPLLLGASLPGAVLAWMCLRMQSALAGVITTYYAAMHPDWGQAASITIKKSIRVLPEVLLSTGAPKSLVYVALLLMAAMFVALIVSARRRSSADPLVGSEARDSHRGDALLIGLSVALPIGLWMLICLSRHVTLVSPQYMAPVWCLWCAGFALGAQAIRDRRLRLAAVGALCVLVLVGDVRWFASTSDMEDWRPVAAVLTRRAASRDIVLVVPPFAKIPLSAHYAGPATVVGFPERLTLDHLAHRVGDDRRAQVDPENLPRAERAFEGAERVWVVLNRAEFADPEHLLFKWCEERWGPPEFSMEQRPDRYIGTFVRCYHRGTGNPPDGSETR